MSNPEAPGTLPEGIDAQLGASLKGWGHLTQTASRVLPTNLRRANLVRRGAIAQIPKLPRGKH